VLFENGQPKPSATSFRFPFVAHRISRTKVRAWGKMPAPGSLLIQRQRRRGWKTISSVGVGGNDVFQIKLSLRGSAVLRAVSGRLASLTWSVN
jgi:hypothetical protein